MVKLGWKRRFFSIGFSKMCDKIINDSYFWRLGRNQSWFWRFWQFFRGLTGICNSFLLMAKLVFIAYNVKLWDLEYEERAGISEAYLNHYNSRTSSDIRWGIWNSISTSCLLIVFQVFLSQIRRNGRKFTLMLCHFELVNLEGNERGYSLYIVSKICVKH